MRPRARQVIVLLAQQRALRDALVRRRADREPEPEEERVDEREAEPHRARDDVARRELERAAEDDEALVMDRVSGEERREGEGGRTGRMSTTDAEATAE